MTKPLVNRLVDYYWEVKDTREAIEAIGRAGSEELTMIDNLLIDLDKMLTNVSKRWAAGMYRRGHIPVKQIHADEEDTIVEVTIRTL